MFTTTQQKVISRLPPTARKKIVRLSADIDAAAAAQIQAHERRRDLHEAIRKDEEILTDLQKLPNADALRILMAREHIALKKQELVEIEEATNGRIAQTKVWHASLRNALEFLSTLPAGATPIADKTAAATLRKGEAFPDAVERCRARADRLRDQLATVSAAPISAALAKERAKNKIEAIAESGRPDLTELIDGTGDIVWPNKVSHLRSGDAVGYVENPNAMALICWLHRDELVAAICRQIDADADDTNALSPEDRAASLEKIAGDILLAEREECSFIDSAIAAGIVIDYRAETSPMAFLGLSGEFTAGPVPDTTPRMSSDQPRRRVEAPVHMSSAPEPALRRDVWN